MEFEIKPSHKLNLNLKELWSYRELIYFFTWRDIKIKYKQTVLGSLWAILQPLLFMIIFTLFVSRALKVVPENLPYPVFVFSGLILWNIFASGIANSGNSMVSNAHILKKIYFPRLIIPISAILATLVDFCMSFLLLFLLLLLYPTDFSMIQLLIGLPMGLMIVLMTTFGLGTFLAALNVKYRDFRYVIPFMIQILLFLTPVIYPVSIVPEGALRFVFELNPLTGALDAFRTAFNGSPLNYALVLKSLSLSLFFFITGIYYFRKTEYYFADLA